MTNHEINAKQPADSLVDKRYVIPFVLITSLFFLWGFSRSVLDVLNKHFQDQMHISIVHSMLIQASTYVAYALMAIPAGIMITRWGYRRGLVTGLLLFAVGCFLFVPGAAAESFGLFLIGFFIIGCGLASLETSANPYAVELGDSRTAPSRLNLAQAFNGLGCMLGPVIVGSLLFSDANISVAIPYGIMGVLVVVMAILFMKVRLPEVKSCGVEDKQLSFAHSSRKIWHKPAFAAGLTTLFFYEIAEIGINSIFINYTTSVSGMGKMTATALLSFGALGIFMVARVAGSALMRKIPARRVLLCCGIGAISGCLITALSSGAMSLAGLLLCYAFEAIMFPTVFAMTIANVGPYAKTASAYLMMTPLGGAVGAWLMGYVATEFSVSVAFFVPAVAYLPVVCYTIASRKFHSESC